VAAPEPKAPSVLRPLAHAQILALQRTAGNQAVARHLARQPAQSVEPPQESSAPPKLAAINHEGQYIATGVDGCYAAMTRVAGAKGAAEAGAWASRFSNMGAIERLSLEAQHDPELVSGTVAAMKAAEVRFDAACKQFLGDFEARAGNAADELLTVSETTVKAEQERLGLKDSRYGHDANSDELEKLRLAAGRLLVKRQEVDALAQTSAAAQTEFERETRHDPFHVDPAAREKADAARRTWSAGEKAYDELARRETAAQPSLAMYTTGGGAASKLAGVSGASPDDQRFLAYRLQHEIDEKLANIAKVRGALGGRFKALKQPPVVRMTKQAMAAEPWQARLVDDHIRGLEAAEADSQLMWTVLSIGLGLLAAIPTGGSSVVAGVAAAGAVGAAGISAYHAYDELADAALQDAAAGTDFDKARAVAESEPDYFWLALDIVGAIADVGQAVQAFNALRAAMRAVKPGELATLRKLAGDCEAAKLSPTGRGQVFAAALADAGGDMTVTLEQMREVFRQLVPPPGEEKWVEYAAQMADYMITERKVVTVRRGAELEDITAWVRSTSRGADEATVQARAAELFQQTEGATGAYLPREDIIVMRSNGTPASVTSVFVHEMTHRKQRLMKVIGKMTEMERELSAFASQRDFLKLVPLEAIPERYHWLRAASDDDIYFYVYRIYGVGFEAAAEVSGIWMTLLKVMREG